MDKHMENEKRNALRGGLFQRESSAEGHYNKKKDWNRIRTGLMTAIAVMLVLSATMGTAWAYFTTYASAKGGVTLRMGHEDEITEEFNSWRKNLTITSTEDSRPVYVRARGFCAEYDLTYSESQNWTPVGDWMYYTKILPPGGEADTLVVRIHDVPKNVTEGAKDGQSFNVIVVYESTEIQYDENGDPVTPENANWDGKVDTTRTTTTLGGGN